MSEKDKFGADWYLVQPQKTIPTESGSRPTPADGSADSQLNLPSSSFNAAIEHVDVVFVLYLIFLAPPPNITRQHGCR